MNNKENLLTPKQYELLQIARKTGFLNPQIIKRSGIYHTPERARNALVVLVNLGFLVQREWGKFVLKHEQKKLKR